MDTGMVFLILGPVAALAITVGYFAGRCDGKDTIRKAAAKLAEQTTASTAFQSVDCYKVAAFIAQKIRAL